MPRESVDCGTPSSSAACVTCSARPTATNQRNRGASALRTTDSSITALSHPIRCIGRMLVLVVRSLAMTTTAPAPAPSAALGHERGSPGYRRLGLAMWCTGLATFVLVYAVQGLL